MNDARIDGLAKVAATTTARRRIAAALGGTALAVLGLAGPAAVGAAPAAEDRERRCQWRCEDRCERRND